MMRSVSLRRGGQFTRPEPPPGFRYYRLAVTSFGPHYSLGIAELELREGAEGPNLAPLGTPSANASFGADWRPELAFDENPATFWSSPDLRPRLGAGGSANSPYASSVFSSSFAAALAFDGNPATYWSTQANVTQATIAFAFVQTATSDPLMPEVREYRIRARSDAADGAPRDWKLQRRLDGGGLWHLGSWEDVHTVTGETDWAPGEERTFLAPSSAPSSAWRLDISANNGRSTLNVAEIEFVGFRPSDSWLQVDFGETPRAVTQYTIRARSGLAEGSPEAWQMLGSNDGVNWEVLHTVTGETDWTLGEERTFLI